jgi:predicted nucleic acid-binding protein
MFTRRAAAKILVDDQEGRVRESAIIECMRLLGTLGIMAFIVENVLTESVKSHALQESSRYDPVRIDLIAAYGDTRALDLFSA